MLVSNLSEVKGHLGQITSERFVRGGLKPSYPPEYYFKVVSWRVVRH